MNAPMHLRVVSRSEAEHATRAGRVLGREVGLDATTAEHVALAVAELSTNLLRYAREGEIVLSVVQGAAGLGVQVESRDRGPGIANLEHALADGSSTGGGLGSGLPATRRLMDEFEIDSSPAGTHVKAIKWPRHR